MLISLETKNLFTYSIVIVDNDITKSAERIVSSFIGKSDISIQYSVEPIQNIALARNRAISLAQGDFIAMIDDDEMPIKNWLLSLYNTLVSSKSDGVLGPVFPYFDKSPPAWILKGRFFERPNHPTGFVLPWHMTRSGNALVKKNVFGTDDSIFHVEFGSGGEDKNFFKRMIEKGFKFTWCAEGAVFESVTEERCKKSYMLRRALLRGQLPQYRRLDYLKSLVAITIYTLVLPVLLLLGMHNYMDILIRKFDHIGRLLSLFGIKAIKEKYLIG